MQKSSEGSPGQAPTPDLAKPERPPLLKKPKTIEDATPHFPGPLFPAVRRTATAPPSRASPASSFPDLRISTGKDDSSSELGIGSFSDRDWVYPSFLGAYPAKARVSIKGKASKSREDDKSLGTSGRLIDAKGKIVSGKQWIDSHPAVALKPKREEREVNSVVSQATVTQSSTASAHSASRRIQELRHSLVIYLLSFVCIVTVTYGLYLQRIVTRLQEENDKLHQVCNSSLVISENSKVFRNEDVESASYWQKTDSRTVALYTVVCTLLMPFILYKYLDHLPHLNKLSTRMKNNQEEVPMKKRIAYMVDVCFSVYPYAKLLALLFATIFLIGFGGLALYA
ncbi:hypothetical protein CRG98_026633, partial [Punica granatum]